MRFEGLYPSFSPSAGATDLLHPRLLPMRPQCLFVASLPLSTSTLVFVVLLANRLSLVLPCLLAYHSLLLPADISNQADFFNGMRRFRLRQLW